MKLFIRNIQTNFFKNEKITQNTKNIQKFNYTNSLNNLYTKVPKNTKTSLFMWSTNTLIGRRKSDLKNKWNFSNNPIRIDFFEGLNPIYIYCGLQHYAIITENGDLYTFGEGTRGILGHGFDLENISYKKPRLVKFFKNENLKVKKVTLGLNHSLALTEDGNLFSWGWGGKLRLPFSYYKGNLILFMLFILIIYL
jgi:alpha-tubulin suppressor-like RCC1 family protein